MNWMVIILTVYYLLHPVLARKTGTGGTVPFL